MSVGAKRAIGWCDHPSQTKSSNIVSWASFDLDNSSREDLVAYLLDSGAWTLFRQRPFNVVADYNEVPRDIFISTFDTAPLAPDLNFIIEGQEADFQKGLDVLGKLTSGHVYLGLNAGGDAAPAKAFTEATGVKKTLVPW